MLFLDLRQQTTSKRICSWASLQHRTKRRRQDLKREGKRRLALYNEGSKIRTAGSMRNSVEFNRDDKEGSKIDDDGGSEDAEGMDGSDYA
jgi:hypothetical protein